MRQRDLRQHKSALLTCPALSYQVRIDKGIAPNDIRFLDGCVVLLIKQSSNGEDFSVSEGAVRYCIKQEEDFDVQSYALACDREGNFIGQTTVKQLMRNLNGYTPRQPEGDKFGPYWWINSNFEVIDSSVASNNRRVNAAPWEREHS